MKMNLIQFQPGLSLNKFLELYGSQEQCEAVEREQTTVLSDRVEVDDAYLGGELPGGKVGRGSENKVPFIAAVQTNNQGHPLYAVRLSSERDSNCFTSDKNASSRTKLINGHKAPITIRSHHPGYQQLR